MTTYILHGGATSKESTDNDNFFKQFTYLVDKENVQILICYFARGKDEWENLLKRDEPKIRKSSNKRMLINIADNAEDLYKKLQVSDVLYVAGGEGEYLEPYYAELNNLESALKGKVYIGSSMGAFMVSRYYVLSFASKKKNEVHKGLGILPINTLCHWNVEGEKEKKIKMLKEADSQSPILFLDEEKFSAFVK